MQEREIQTSWIELIEPDLSPNTLMGHPSHKMYNHDECIGQEMPLKIKKDEYK